MFDSDPGQAATSHAARSNDGAEAVSRHTRVSRDDSKSRDRRYRYHAFISYSHKADADFSRVFQSAIEQLGKPWYRRRALNIFRDETDLAVNPKLWPRIEAALNESEYLLLLASPEAAKSEGVRKEVRFWTDSLKRDSSKVLIAVTGGALVWDQPTQDFDWSRTNALPAELKTYFREHPEPLWADCSTFKSGDKRRFDDANFRLAAVKVAAGLHGLSPRDLESEDLRQHRRTIRNFGALVILLFLLLIGALLLFKDAREQRRVADARARVALSRALAMQAMDRSDKDLDLALLLSVESHRIADTPESRKAMLDNLLANPYVYRFINRSDETDAVATTSAKPRLTEVPNGVMLEWGPSSDQSRRRLIVPLTEGDGVISAAVSPTEDVVAFSTRATGIRLWDVSTSRYRTAKFEGHSGPITSLAFSRDGHLIASGGLDEAVLVSDATTGSIVQQWLQQGEVSAVQFSPDNRYLAWGSYRVQGIVSVFDFKEDRLLPISLLRTGPISALAFSPDSQKLTVSPLTGGRPLELDLTNESRIASVRPAHAGWIIGLAFSPDGRLAASAGNDGRLILWDAQRKQIISQIKLGGQVGLCMSFSPDGKTLITCHSEGRLAVFQVDGASLARVGTISAPNQEMRAIAFSPSGQALVSGGGGRLLLWNSISLSQSTPTELASVNKDVITIEFDPKGNVIAAGCADGSIYLIGLNGKQIGELKWGANSIRGLKFSLDGASLYSASTEGIVTWNLRTLSRVGTPLDLLHSGADSIAMSDDGKIIASGSRSRSVGLWDVEHRILLGRLPGYGDSIFSLAFAPNGKILAAGSGFSGLGHDALMFWDVDPEVWAAQACAIAGRNLNSQEWVRYIGDESPRNTCPGT